MEDLLMMGFSSSSLPLSPRENHVRIRRLKPDLGMFRSEVSVFQRKNREG